MLSIRYWGRVATPKSDMQTNAGQNESDQVKNVSDFQSALQEKLIKPNYLLLIDQALGGSCSELPIPTDIMGDDPARQLMNLNVKGIEKVWAEQLKSPLYQLNATSSDKKKNYSSTGLDDMISLTVREQLLKVKKKLARDNIRSDERNAVLIRSYTNNAK